MVASNVQVGPSPRTGAAGPPPKPPRPPNRGGGAPPPPPALGSPVWGFAQGAGAAAAADAGTSDLGIARGTRRRGFCKGTVSTAPGRLGRAAVGRRVLRG